MASLSDYADILSLDSVRDQARIVLAAAESGDLTNFDYHEERLQLATDFVLDLILRDWKPSDFPSIPPHGRWQHFNVGGIARLDAFIDRMQSDGQDALEQARCVVDLITVSVLLDAGAGDKWTFNEGGQSIGRSEGLAVASFHTFSQGIFGRNCVDATILINLRTEDLAKGMQSTSANPLVGIEGRAALLRSLGQSLLALPEIFGGRDIVRPGNIVDYLLKHSSPGKSLNFDLLWDALQKLLLPSWPKGRTTVGGSPVGDTWPLEVLRKKSDKTKLAIQPFHKLTQWLAYSLTSALERLLQRDWSNLGALTGLPEYRNGGLFVDLEVLTLKEEVLRRGLEASSGPLPQYAADDDVIVEWRAMTVALLDIIALKVNEQIVAMFGPECPSLSLAQILEAGTWKAGRELAQKYRSQLRSCSPILIVSDGTLF